MLTLRTIYKDEFKDSFVKDFLDPNYSGAKYLLGTNALAKSINATMNINGFINTCEDMSEFMCKPVLHNNDLYELDSNALVVSCVHEGSVINVNNLLSKFHFRHIDCFSFALLANRHYIMRGGDIQ